jgi:hypothetical protein
MLLLFLMLERSLLAGIAVMPDSIYLHCGAESDGQ